MTEATGSHEGEGYCSSCCSMGWLQVGREGGDASKEWLRGGRGGGDASKASFSKPTGVEVLKLGAT